MTLVQAWVDSVSLLKPKNLKLFLLVTLKSIIEAYKIMAIYWSWLIALIAVCCFVAPLLENYIACIGFIAIYFLYQMLLFAACLSTRPSVMQKNCDYFRFYKGHFFYVSLLGFFFLVPLLLKNLTIAALIFPLYAPWYIFSMLFFLDSKKSFKNFFLAMWRALKMFVYNYPLLFLVSILCVVPNYLSLKHITNTYFGFVPFYVFYLQNFIGAFLVPIVVCTYTNIYVKKLHDQFDLYFTQPK